MSAVQPPLPAVTVIDQAHCEALFAGTAAVTTETAFARALPVTERSWRSYYREQAVPNPDPWWLDCTTPDAAGPDSSSTGIAWVDPALPYFAGHFPGAPILPGVVQLNWAVQFVDRMLPGASADRFAGLARIKFKAPVAPGMLLRYSLRSSPGKVRLQIASHANVHTEGQLLYRD